MKASNITNIVSKLIKERLPVFIWGAPGIGKSSIVKAIAKDMNLEFIDLRLALLDPTDLKGIPFFDSKTNQGVWAKPSFLPDSSSQSKGILFLDEIEQNIKKYCKTQRKRKTSRKLLNKHIGFLDCFKVFKWLSDFLL